MYLFKTSSLQAINNQDQILSPFNEFNANIKNYNQKLIIINNNNEVVAKFKVKVVINPEEQKYGLMHITFLPENLGMLFKNESPKIINMWMKNTKIPLDMIFIDENYNIVNIVSNTTPNSIATISSKQPAIGVLEINAGLANKYKIIHGYKLILEKI